MLVIVLIGYILVFVFLGVIGYVSYIALLSWLQNEGRENLYVGITGILLICFVIFCVFFDGMNIIAFWLMTEI